VSKFREKLSEEIKEIKKILIVAVPYIIGLICMIIIIHLFLLTIKIYKSAYYFPLIIISTCLILYSNRIIKFFGLKQDGRNGIGFFIAIMMFFQIINYPIFRDFIGNNFIPTYEVKYKYFTAYYEDGNSYRDQDTWGEYTTSSFLYYVLLWLIGVFFFLTNFIFSLALYEKYLKSDANIMIDEFSSLLRDSSEDNMCIVIEENGKRCEKEMCIAIEENGKRCEKERSLYYKLYTNHKTPFCERHIQLFAENNLIKTIVDKEKAVVSIALVLRSYIRLIWWLCFLLPFSVLEELMMTKKEREKSDKANKEMKIKAYTNKIKQNVKLHKFKFAAYLKPKKNKGKALFLINLWCFDDILMMMKSNEHDEIIDKLILDIGKMVDNNQNSNEPTFRELVNDTFPLFTEKQRISNKPGKWDSELQWREPKAYEEEYALGFVILNYLNVNVGSDFKIARRFQNKIVEVQIEYKTLLEKTSGTSG